MTISTSSDARAWTCYPAYHGLLLQRAKPLDGKTFLPAAKDQPLAAAEPPLSLALSETEYAALVDHRFAAATLNTAVAATCYGPSNQDKASNEDYAISTVVDGWAFAAVADGVSQKTFWAARTARVACLIAFRTFCRYIATSDATTDESLTCFRDDLADALRGALHEEKQHLLKHGTIPSRFDADVYRRNSSRDDLWFNSTLLVAALGEYCGFVLWAGDGGIVIRKRLRDSPPEEKVALRSGEDASLSSHVGLNVTSNQFTLRRLDYTNVSQIDVYLASDGVDRTLAKRGRAYTSLYLTSSESARNELEKLAASDGAIPDNFSVAKIARWIAPSSIVAIREPRKAAAPKVPSSIPALTPPPPLPNPQPAVHAKPKGRRIGSRAFALALVSIGVFAAGFVTALLMSALLHREQFVYFVHSKPKIATPFPSPFEIDQPAAGSFASLEKAKGLLEFIDASVSAVRRDPGPYTIVVSAPPIDGNCAATILRATTRSQAVAATLNALLHASGTKAEVFAAHNVRPMPANSEHPFRLMLQRGHAANHECTEP